MIPGIDVSHYQLDIDWRKVKRAGCQFAFIKGMEFLPKTTVPWTDSKLAQNVAGCRDYDIMYGIYLFYRTHINPYEQAMPFVELIHKYVPDLPPVIDLELSGRYGKELSSQVQAFLGYLEKEIPVKPIIYTSGGFWRSYMIYNRFENAEWAAPYPLWLAQWGGLMPSTLWPWLGATFWQYTQKGRCPGIKTFVDQDWFLGDLPALLFLTTQMSSTRTLRKLPKRELEAMGLDG
jgi:lysozyme